MLRHAFKRVTPRIVTCIVFFTPAKNGYCCQHWNVLQISIIYVLFFIVFSVIHQQLSVFCWVIFHVCFSIFFSASSTTTSFPFAKIPISFIVFCVTIINYVRLRKYYVKLHHLFQFTTCRIFICSVFFCLHLPSTSVGISLV